MVISPKYNIAIAARAMAVSLIIHTKFIRNRLQVYLYTRQHSVQAVSIGKWQDGFVGPSFRTDITPTFTQGRISRASF